MISIKQLDHAMLIALILFQIFTFVNGAGSASASPSAQLSTYESIKALNEYGESVQIQHAQSAVDKYGRLIVAIRISKETVWIVSPWYPPPPYERKRQQAMPTRRLLDPITSNSNLVCTGIQPDSVWLLKELQSYGRDVLRQLDQSVVDPMVAALVQRRFLGYDTQRMWKGLAVSDPKEDSQMGRPLGVCSFLVSHRSEDQGFVRVHQIDTSGHVKSLDRDRSFMAIGRGSEVVEQNFQVGDEEELEQNLLQVFELAVGAKDLHVEVVYATGEVSTRLIQR